VLAMVVAVAVAVAAAPAGAGLRGLRFDATVDHVIDGDTIVLADDAHVRLIGIDTPEVAGPYTRAECFGQRATAFARKLLPDGQDVGLELDAEERDRHGRLLAYVYRARDGLFVNAEMVRKGYAFALTVPPNVEHADELRRLAERARERERGLWSECEGR
jgi:micrococcal nuclease